MTARVEPGLPGHPKCFRGVCGNCGRAAPGERALHTTIETDHQDGIYHDLYLCESCVTEWGRLFGMASEVEATRLKDSVASQADIIHNLRATLEHYAHLEALIADGERARQEREQEAQVVRGPEGQVMVPVVPKGRR